MDEMKIKTPFMRAFIAGLIEKTIKSKFGYDVDIKFDNIALESDDESALMNLQLSVEMTNESLKELRKNVIGF